MKKMAAMLFALTLAAGMAFAAAESEGAAEGPVEVEVWLDSNSGDVRQERWETMVLNPYTEANPNVLFEIALIANLYDATRTALASGAGPDLVMTYGPFALELGRNKLLVPLDGFVDQYGWDDHFAPWSLASFDVDGAPVALPDEIETLVLYYNETLFEQHGWQVPDTMDELFAVAEQVEAAGIIPFGHANECWRGTNEWFIGEFLNGWAGPAAVYEAIIGNRSFAEPVFVESMQLLTDMQQNGWFSGGLDRYYTVPCATAGAMFGNGEAAMRISGTWSIGGFSNEFGAEAGNDNDWNWTPMPTKSGVDIFNVGIGNAFAISAHSDHPEAVAALLDYYYSSEVQGRRFVNHGKAPAPVEVDPFHLQGADQRYIDLLSTMNKAFAADNYGYTTWVFWGPKTNQYMIEEIERLWAGDITAQEYMEGWQKLHVEEMAEGMVPPAPAR
ncbi:MAG: extracellular solute-binding protein [Spirochaetaceae bacterium]|nr:extracellular solute-binding protein [Spirochaetaceae bacterium]